MNRFQCRFCSANYKNLRDLNSHEKKKHGVSKKFQCSRCNAQTNYIRNLHRHERLKHNIVRDKKEERKKNVKFTLVKCHLCTTCIRITKLVDHYKSEHSLDVVFEERQFTSYGDFKSWKMVEEEQTQSKFVKMTSTMSYKKCDGENVSYEYFSCQHSGTHITRSKGLRKRRSKKIGVICPAEMKLTIFSGGMCNLKYVKTHVGHDEKLENIEIPNIDNKLEIPNIDNKLEIPNVDDMNNCNPVETQLTELEFPLQTSHNLELIDNSVIVIVEPYQENAIILDNSPISLQQKREEISNQFQVLLNSVESIEELMFIEGECQRIQSQLSGSSFD